MSRIFLGFQNVILLKMIENNWKVDLVILENSPLSAIVQKTCESHHIPFVYIKTISDIIEATAHLDQIEICLVGGFGVILKDNFIKKCKTIVNFHPADVFTCRGRHAFPQNILNRSDTMCLSVHCIDSERIDAGPILVRLFAPLSYSSSYAYNDQKMIELIECAAGYIIEDFNKYGFFSSYKWVTPKQSYFKPIEREAFLKIINSTDLQKTLELL